MKLSDEQIDSIAQEVDMGMDVYLHKETSETVIIPNDSLLDYGDSELWEEDIRKVEDHRDEYLIIEDMSSREGYGVMEDFVNQIEDESIQTVLEVMLSNAKPFRNFKNTLPRYPEVRQQWFDFKKERKKQWVRDQIEAADLSF